MAETFVPWTPPSWVPGPYVEPATTPRFQKPVTQPHWRYIDVPESTTLHALAMKYYRSPGEATRIYNDNMSGKRMPDGTAGIIGTPNQIIMPGQRVWLS